MAKRAVDLSMADLATMGAKAAQRAAQKAHDAGLMVAGTPGEPLDQLARGADDAVTLVIHQKDGPLT